jgi:hypothetical protein
MKLAVPAYIYPSSSTAWSSYNTSVAANAFLVANDANGDMISADPNYVSIINASKAAGNKVIGYIYSNYAARPLAAMYARIDAWFALYPNIDGIFIDEVSSSCSTVAYYQSIVSYVTSKGGTVTALNPGGPVPSCFDGIATAICTFEGSEASYSNYSAATWTATATSKIWHIIYASTSCVGGTVEGLVATAASKHADYLFVTGDDGSRPE